MFGRNMVTYQTNSAWGDRWYIYNTNVYTNMLEWGVLVFVKRRTGYIGGDIDATKDLGILLIVGVPSIITPSVGVFSAENEFVAAQYGTPQYSSEIWGDLSANSYRERGVYRYYDSGSGSIEFGTENVDYTFESISDFYAALDNGEISQIIPKVYFDVYVNGTDKPSIFVNWTADEDLAISMLKPSLWIGVDDFIPIVPEFITQDGYNIPNTGAWNIDFEGGQTYAGSYSTTFLSLMTHFENFLNAVSKVEHWGFDGVPANVRLYLRMDYDGGATWGDLQKVTINKNGSYGNTQIASSGFGNYTTIVRFHVGEPDYILPDDSTDYASGTNADGDGDGRYSEVPDTEFIEDNEGNGFDGNAVLTKTYSVSAATLQNVGQKLWSQSYFDVLKIQNNPIENIISVKAFPFATSGTAEEIKVGDIAFGVNGDKIPSVVKKHIGAVKYSGHFGSYLDLNPYTIIKINLPYCGLVQLDASDIFNSELSVDYIIDMISGECMAMLTLDKIPYMNVKGQMGIDITLSATDRVQSELKNASAGLSVVGGAAGQLISGNVGGGVISGMSGALSLVGTDYNTQRTGQQAPACASFQNHGVFLMVERPLQLLGDVDSAGYKHLHGLPCNKFMSFNQLNGFVAVDRRTDINIAMTKEENEILEQLLTEGVYI